MKGIFNNNGEIVLNSMRTIKWDDISNEKHPELPSGTDIDLSISFDQNIFLTGINGIVWATYDPRQAEIIHNTLLAQQISSEIKRIDYGSEFMLLIKILNANDLNEVMDFIWKGVSGLRLKPDWSYPEGEINKSFEQWLSGH